MPINPYHFYSIFTIQRKDWIFEARSGGAIKLSNKLLFQSFSVALTSMSTTYTLHLFWSFDRLQKTSVICVSLWTDGWKRGDNITLPLYPLIYFSCPLSWMISFFCSARGGKNWCSYMNRTWNDDFEIWAILLFVSSRLFWTIVWVSQPTFTDLITLNYL